MSADDCPWEALKADAARQRLGLVVRRGREAGYGAVSVHSTIGVTRGQPMVTISVYDLGDADHVLLAAATAAVAALPDPEHDRVRVAAYFYEVQGGRAPWADVTDDVRAACLRLADAAIAAGADPRKVP